MGKNSEIIKESREFPNISRTVIARDKDDSIKPYIEDGIPEKEAVLHENVWRDIQIEITQLSCDSE
ncbi:hypothetical protein [Bacillus sp. 2205SS5-2]|uniref:hypothetical protein n=1 Tax=Bacillus sp. 2205SS5-2 TaxID=3109031 RepID=UPI003007A037